MHRALVLLALVATFIAAQFSSCGDDPSHTTGPAATYVGRESCATCHGTQHERWVGSHHDLAMQAATPATVLGDFDSTAFEHFGTTTEFFRRGDTFHVRTDGPDGIPTEYEVKYTFGVTPLQQYLLELPGGRLQALGTCWDTRPRESGGQRWFHLYDEPIPHDDELHWTGPNQNWNYMCASCHSTNLQRNYDIRADSYDTTWSEIDVSCESCHGPASTHVEWARSGADPDDTTKGLAVTLSGDHSWVLDPDATTARRDPPLTDHAEIEACAACHSRRGILREGFGPFMDNYLPALLEAPNYHADGQILEEVYVWGSFVQSKMYHAGVSCSDCHEPHSLGMRAPGNALCIRCHKPDVFDVPSHHHHEANTPGASCVDCHMPERTYMVVDPRRDHSLRIPRPDLTTTLQTPNACNNCHSDQTPEWAAARISDWTKGKALPTHFGETLNAARNRTQDAPSRLRKLALDPDAPAIARASALALLADLAAPEEALNGLRDTDALVRMAALRTLHDAPIDYRIAAGPLVRDPVRAVRIEAARILAPVPPDRLLSDLRAPLESAIDEFIAARKLNSDQPWAHVHLGELYMDLGRPQEAEKAYLDALGIDATHVVARANLSDLYRTQERDDLGEACLREGLEKTPDSAELLHALGLLCTRGGRSEEALRMFEQAARLRPENPHFCYVFAVALYSSGKEQTALDELASNHKRHPSDLETLSGLVTYHHARNEPGLALGYARTLQKIVSNNPGVTALVQELERETQK